MQVIVSGLEEKVALKVTDSYGPTARVQHRAATMALLRLGAQAPLLTADWRAVALVADPGHTPAQRRVQQLAVADVLTQLAVFLDITKLADMQRVSRDIFSGGILTTAAWTATGIPAALAAAGVGAQAVLDLVLYAVEGIAPPQTESGVINIARNALMYHEPVDAVIDARALTASTDWQDAVNVAFIARSAAALRGLLELPRAAPVAPSGVIELTMRSALIRDLAGSLYAAELAACNDVLQQRLAWLQHPWVRAAARGNLMIQIADLVDLAAGTLPEVKDAPPAVYGLPYGLDFSVGYRPAAPAQMLALPVGYPAAAGNPLVSDATLMVAITPADVAAFAGVTYGIIAHMQDIGARRASVLGSNPRWTHTLTLASDVSHHSVQHVKRVHEGWPLVGNTDTELWTEDARSLRVAAGGSPWIARTLANVVQTVETARPSFDGQGVTPIAVRGESTVTPTALPALEPIFDVFDVLVPGFPPTAQGLSDAWAITPAELQATIGALPPVEEQLGLRAFAEQLRFLGVLAIRREGAYTVILPNDRMYYHLDGAAALGYAIAHPHPQAPNGSVLGVLDDNEAELVLLPFSAVPSSVAFRNIERHIAVRPQADVRPHEPVAQWIASGTEASTQPTPVLPIRAVARAENLILELVLLISAGFMNKVPSGGVLHVFGQDNEPRFARLNNAIVFLDDEASTQAVVQSVPVAPRVLL